MADKSKDVIYIDIDDEITSIIDKVRASDGKILALVLPKRASVFQEVSCHPVVFILRSHIFEDLPEIAPV